MVQAGMIIVGSFFAGFILSVFFVIPFSAFRQARFIAGVGDDLRGS